MQSVDVSDSYQAMPPRPSNPPTDYEFDERQNSVFAGLASAMRFVGTASMVVGMIMFLGALKGDATSIVGALVQGTLSVLVGMWTRGAATSIQQIATTEGNDIANLMDAMAELRKIYNLQRVLIVIVLCVLAVALVAVFAMGMK